MHSFVPHMNEYLITTDMAKEITSTNMAKLIKIGEYAALGEKLKKYFGRAPIARYVPSKPDRYGHWFT